MKTSKGFEKLIEQQTRILEEDLEKTGKTNRQVRRKRRERIKYLVSSTALEKGKTDF